MASAEFLQPEPLVVPRVTTYGQYHFQANENIIALPKSAPYSATVLLH